MGFYLGVLLIFALLAFLEANNPKMVKKYRFVFALSAFMLLVLHDGLRWETGSDWTAYLSFFETVHTMTTDDIYFEPGFFYFVQSVRFLTDEYTVYLLLHAILFYSLLFYCIFKLSPQPFLAILLLYMVIVPYLGMNRQFLALACSMAGLVFLVRRERGLFVLMILFAALFHKSALCCLIFPLFARRYSNVVLIGALLVCIAVSLSGVVNTIAPALSLLMMDENRSDTYMGLNMDFSLTTMMVSLARRIIWVLLLMFYERAVENKSRTYYLLFNIYFFSLLIYVLCNGTLLQPVVSRLLIYFGIAEIFILPYLLSVFKKRRDKIILVLLFTAYAWINIYKGIMSDEEYADWFVPYRGLFINTNVIRFGN